MTYIFISFPSISIYMFLARKTILEALNLHVELVEMMNEPRFHLNLVQGSFCHDSDQTGLGGTLQPLAAL